MVTAVEMEKMKKVFGKLGLGNTDEKGEFVATKKGERLESAITRHAMGERISADDLALVKEFMAEMGHDENGEPIDPRS